MRLSEAFKALDALNEDTFTLSDDGIRKLAEFENNDDLVDELSVIDLDAETEEDFQDSYVGKVILDCCVCHSKLYKDKADVKIDEESQLANVGEDCPYCYTPDGFKIVGQVAEFVGEEDDNTEKEPEESEETTETDDKETEELDEGIFGKKTSEKTIKASQLKKGDLIVATEDGRQDKPLKVKAIGNNGGSVAIDFPGGNMSISPDEDVTILTEGIFDKKSKGTKTIKASQLQRGHQIVATQDGKQDKPLKVKNVGENGGSVTVDFNGGNMSIHPDEDVEILAEDILDVKTKDESKSIKEDINNLSLDTDDTHLEMTSDNNGKVTITTEPVNNVTDDLSDGDEVVVPVSNETITEIENNSTEEPTEGEDDIVSDTEVDLEIDDFDEESFDDLGEQYFREAYENVETFKTSNVTETKKGLMVEGVLKFTSGSTKKTSFLFESKLIDKEDTVKFIGENIDIKTGKAAFTMTGKVSENKLILESLSYNYETNDEEGNKNKVSGIVKRG